MLNEGQRATLAEVVTDKNSASSVGSGLLPVYATPSLAALVEKTACAVLEGHLDAGQTSVGVSLEIEHTAPSLIGATVSCTCTLVGAQGRTFDFEAVLSDGAGPVGRCRHRRVAVDGERFMTRARERALEQKS